MTVVSQNDDINRAIILRDEMCKINQYLEGKISPDDLTKQEKDTVCKLYRDKIRNELRHIYSLSVDHQIFAKHDFTDIYGIEIKKEEQGSLYFIDLTPTEVTGFVNLRKKYQYFHVNKISVTFVSNSASNLTPIICKYLPPTSVDAMKIDSDELDQITKFAESAGSNSGYLSVHNPYYLIQTIEKVTQGNTTEEKITDTWPILSDQILITNYKSTQKVSYGSLIFECKNMPSTNPQSILAKVTFTFDFYSGIDYNNVVSDGQSDGGDGGNDGDNDGGDDDPNVPGGNPNAGCCRRTFANKIGQQRPKK